MPLARRRPKHSCLAAAFLTGLTLYVIPSWATHTYTTDVRLTDAAGTEVGKSTYNHSFKLVQQLFLLFGMPFAYPDSVHDAMWDAVTNDVTTWTLQTIDGA